MSTQKDNKDMCTKANVFFGGISTLLLTAAAFEILSVYHLKDQCPQLNLDTAPLVAGGTLFGTFFLSALWRFAVKKKKKGEKKKGAEQVSIFLWTAAMVIGIAAAGATLGQIELYGTVCAALKDNEWPFRTIQYVSIAFLVASVAMPHAWSQEKNNEPLSTLGAPVTSIEDVTEDGRLKKRSPLVFL